MRSAAQAVESATHWEGLASYADRMGDWEREHGRHDGVYRNQAKMYRDAAKACQLEAKTGLPHCSCCLKPDPIQPPYWRR